LAGRQRATHIADDAGSSCGSADSALFTASVHNQYCGGIRYCGGDIDYATFDVVSACVGFDTTRATPHHKLGIPSVGIDYDHYHYYRQTHIRTK